jgi:hypothetical protein
MVDATGCRRIVSATLALIVALASPATVLAEGDWETTPESEAAVRRGLAWLAANQTQEGNWESNDLGLVSMGALAFLSAGHMPGIGKYGQNVERALQYVVTNAKPSGLLNIADSQRDMYNHGLSTFVLGQAHGMTGDARISNALDRALKLIANTQCNDGGWDYRARPQQNGHDLSLAVMQAKALRSAVDSGLEVPPEVIELAIASVREHYHPRHGNRNAGEAALQNGPGQFTYSKGGGQGTIAMAAAGVVCMQEFGQYDDWRIAKNMEVIVAALQQQHAGSRNGQVPWDAYTLYYVGQALYQVGGQPWRDNYPKLRDHLVAVQVLEATNLANDGKWQSGGHVGGKPGELYGTSVAVFILAMPNRYLPILQEGHIDSLRSQFTGK